VIAFFFYQDILTIVCWLFLMIIVTLMFVVILMALLF